MKSKQAMPAWRGDRGDGRLEAGVLLMHIERQDYGSSVEIALVQKRRWCALIVFE